MGALTGAAVALTTMLTASACLFDGSQASSEGGPQKQEAGAQAPATAPAAAPEKTLASRDTSSGGSKIRVALTSLARQGNLATVNFTATVLATDDSTGWQVSDFFGTGEPTGPPPGKTDLVNGVFLIDGTNKKKHLVATDTNRNCVCTGNLSGTFVRQGQSIVLSATFAAPPDNVNAVDVNVPHAGTFRNVPLS